MTQQNIDTDDFPDEIFKAYDIRGVVDNRCSPQSAVLPEFSCKSKLRGFLPDFISRGKGGRNCTQKLS